jgi:hypothetical protein
MVGRRDASRGGCRAMAGRWCACKFDDPRVSSLHENFIMSLIPLHLAMRQYWRDFDALEAWARSTPHREWWRDKRDSSEDCGKGRLLRRGPHG